MNIESRLKKIATIGALSAALLFSPVQNMQEAYAQTASSRIEYKKEFYRLQVKRYTDKFDALIKSYDLGTAKAIYSGFAENLTLEEAISNAKQVASNPIASTYPKELQYSIIRSSERSSIENIVTYITEIDKIIKDALGSKYDRTKELKRLCPFIEAVSTGSYISDQDLFNLYYNYDLRPLDSGDFIKAASKAFSADIDTLYLFGKSLIEEKKYPQDIACAAIFTLGRNKQIKDEIIKITDSFIAKGYSKGIIKGMIIAYGLVYGRSEDYLEKDLWKRNSPEDLEFVVSILKGKYDDDVISDTLKLFVKTDK